MLSHATKIINGHELIARLIAGTEVCADAVHELTTGTSLGWSGEGPAPASWHTGRPLSNNNRYYSIKHLSHRFVCRTDGGDMSPDRLLDTRTSLSRGLLDDMAPVESSHGRRYGEQTSVRPLSAISSKITYILCRNYLGRLGGVVVRASDM